MDAPTPEEIRTRSAYLTETYPDDSGGPNDLRLVALIDGACGLVMLLTARTVGLSTGEVQPGVVGPFGCLMEDVPPPFVPFVFDVVARFCERAAVTTESEIVVSSIEAGAGGLASFTAGPYSESYFRPGEVTERRSLDADPTVAAQLWALATSCARAAWERLWNPALAGLYEPATAFESYDWFPEGATWIPSSWPYSSWPGPDGF